MTRRINLTLCAVWIVLAVVSGLNDWGWGWTAFFSFAAGERWGLAWMRGKS